MLLRLPAFIFNAAILLLLLGYVLYPTLATVRQSFLNEQASFTAQYYAALFSAERFAVFRNTVVLSLATVALSGVFGVLLAYSFWRFRFPAKALLSTLFLLPLGLPPLVGVFSFQFLYSESGIVPRFLQSLFGLSTSPFSFEGFWAVLVIHVYSFYVHFFLFASSALARTDYALLEAGENLGASRLTVVFRVLLPLLRPALLSAGLIVFILSVASFTAPLLFGGRSPFLTVEIYTQKTAGSLGDAAALTVGLMMISILALYFFERYAATHRAALAQRGATREVSLERINPVFTALLSMMALFVLLPIAVLVLMSFAENTAASRTILPAMYSFKNYFKVFSEPTAYQPFLNSLTMALLASVPNLLFGLVAGILLAQRRIYAREFVSLLLLLPLALPGTALAVNLIAAFSKPSPLSFGTALVGSYTLLPLAYFIRHLPYITRSVSSALESFDYTLVEAASTLGTPYIRVIGRVIVPVILTAVASGFLFTFISALSEFPCSVMIYNPDNVPISVDIFSQFRLGDFGAASAEGVLLMLLVFALTWISSAVFRTSSSRSGFDF
ncbi:MAG: hypothetical protein HY22_04990 [[Candidatus Thermochlorobacteriaceae] bacterium GBChlB]|nr:MAG: hypothetical protein HY22_04990 [[Candidatus Thermochlorobacteriaceae] bacterium GBChlB]